VFGRDVLHEILQGVARHLIGWILEYISARNDGKTLLQKYTEAFPNIPVYQNLRIFVKGVHPFLNFKSRNKFWKNN
jgi:hypothetical protein